MFKKILKYLFYTFLTLLIVGFIAFYAYLKTTAPKYKGIETLAILEAEVTVNFDKYAIPHIYAQNASDAYRALGYVHAQDRLFQMEMVRRLSSGRLAEILGDRLVETDKFFRILGIRRMAEETAGMNFENIDEDWKKYALAYLEGINQFVDSGSTPLEFIIMGIPKAKFEPADIYSVLGYMGLGFSRALKEDPILEKIRLRYGVSYFDDWLLDTNDLDSLMLTVPNITDLGALISNDVERYLADAGLPLWYGSNGWVISADRSASGKVLLANDTHIGISQPSVWYEAHISYPGFDFYGNHLAGVPFGVIGHSRDLGWGLTIFPFDGLDLYRERLNPENDNQVWENDMWVDMELQPEMIKVKDGKVVFLERKVTRHGPLINEVVSALDSNEMNPISFWWGFLDKPTTTLEAIYGMNTARNMQDVKMAASKIDFIGLNILYGDKEGNIAHWAAGRIPKRPAHVNPKFILDGASGDDELLGFYEFSENPMSENPVSGYVASANNDPGSVNGNYFHGYYCPPNRINRIKKHLETKEIWNQNDLKSIQLDEISDEHKEMAVRLANILIDKFSEEDDKSKAIINALKFWDGGYELEQVEPVIFTKLLYHTMCNAMADELGMEDFNSLQGSYIYKGSLPKLVGNESSVWWDDVNTPEVKERREDAVIKAFKTTLLELNEQLGQNWNNWKWKKVHSITHNHPLGAIKPLDRFFNVGPFPVSGGNDVPNKMMYQINQDGEYKVNSSPALRILLDFANVDVSESINPTGQSGNVMSPHYKDQTHMFNKGVYRPQLMNKSDIDLGSTTLVLKPEM
jgi:penicillin amidase